MSMSEEEFNAIVDIQMQKMFDADQLSRSHGCPIVALILGHSVVAADMIAEMVKANPAGVIADIDTMVNDLAADIRARAHAVFQNTNGLN
jgi:hypothetical protein